MTITQYIIASLILVMVMPWADRWSRNWLASFRQWQTEDQYYQQRKGFLLVCRQSWVSYSIKTGKCVQDRLQAIDDELTQLKDYYGY